MKVTSQQLDFFEEEGYVIIKGGLTDDDLAPLIEDHNIIVDEIARDLHGQGKIANLYGKRAV